MSNFVNATLSIQEGISHKTGEPRPYEYVSVQVDSEEISRIFLPPIVLRALGLRGEPLPRGSHID